MLRADFHLTKRHLGFLAVLIGVGVLIVSIVYDLVGGSEGGFGASQKAALALSLITIFVGLTLIPLGDQPA